MRWASRASGHLVKTQCTPGKRCGRTRARAALVHIKQSARNRAKRCLCVAAKRAAGAPRRQSICHIRAHGASSKGAHGAMGHRGHSARTIRRLALVWLVVRAGAGGTAPAITHKRGVGEHDAVAALSLRRRLLGALRRSRHGDETIGELTFRGLKTADLPWHCLRVTRSETCRRNRLRHCADPTQSVVRLAPLAEDPPIEPQGNICGRRDAQGNVDLSASADLSTLAMGGTQTKAHMFANAPRSYNSSLAPVCERYPLCLFAVGLLGMADTPEDPRYQKGFFLAFFGRHSDATRPRSPWRCGRTPAQRTHARAEPGSLDGAVVPIPRLCMAYAGSL